MPVRWKSLTSGTIHTLRRDGANLYFELEISEEAKQPGMFAFPELYKDGAKWIGVQRGTEVWWNVNPNTGEKVITERCVMEYPFEINLFTPSRIEGRSFGPPANAKFDYKKCKLNKPYGWRSFVRVPE